MSTDPIVLDTHVWLDIAFGRERFAPLVTKTVAADLAPSVAVDAVELPAWDHGDPADRLIVATARALSAMLVTRDVKILDYAERTRAVRILEPA